MIKISLKAARVNAGLSQKEVAELTGYSNATICSWENGRSFPKQPAIEVLCRLYGVPYDRIAFKANN